MPDPFVAVGGDAAGLSAASKCKREAPEREAIVLERGPWVSYAHCGEPYFVKGAVESLDDLLSLSPADIEERGIDLRRGHEAVALDTDRRVLTVEGPDGTYEQPYGDLLLATGARALTDPIEGTDAAGVHAMHGLDDAAAARAHLLDPGADPLTEVGGTDYVDRERVERAGALAVPERAAIVGGGYVGIEMAEALAEHGLEVHLFQRGDRVLPPFGAAVADVIEDELEARGVRCHLDSEVSALRGDPVEAIAYDGEELAVDLALVGIGIRPNTELTEGTPIERGDSGAVATDEYGRTSVEAVYAAGDCAEMEHAVTGEPTWVPLGLTANRAGRAIGQTVAGDPEPVGTVAGTAVVKAFAQECGRTGLLPEAARAAGFDPVSETITAGSRSGYYPGAAETRVTLVADRDSGRLLGGTVVGEDRAAVRIDTVAMALERDATVADLERADLAYAPPFSPVWDPVLVAAKVLRGTLES